MVTSGNSPPFLPPSLCLLYLFLSFSVFSLSVCLSVCLFVCLWVSSGRSLFGPLCLWCSYISDCCGYTYAANGDRKHESQNIIPYPLYGIMSISCLCFWTRRRHCRQTVALSGAFTQLQSRSVPIPREDGANLRVLNLIYYGYNWCHASKMENILLPRDLFLLWICLFVCLFLCFTRKY